MLSRNFREGHYFGKVNGRHVRDHFFKDGHRASIGGKTLNRKQRKQMIMDYKHFRYTDDISF